MALNQKEMDFLLDLLKGMLNLTKVNRENKAVAILKAQKKKKAAKKEVKESPTKPKMGRSELAAAIKYFNNGKMSNENIARKLLFLSNTNQPTDYSRPKVPMAG